MSVRALTWSFGLDLNDMAAKAVLHALADHADENGVSWPSIDRIARWAGCSESTARRALQRVEQIGAVVREERPGRTDVYRLNFGWNPSQNDTPSKLTGVSTRSEGVSGRHPRGVRLTGEGCQPDTRTVKEPPVNRQEPSHERATRLPEDWKPSDDLVGFARDHGLDPAEAAAEFADFWRGVPGTKGKKLDWDATFRNRCRELSRRGGRGGGKGFRPAGRSGEIAALVRGAARVGRDEPL